MKPLRTIFAGTAACLLLALPKVVTAQNHNPYFEVSDVHLGGSDYVFVPPGDDDTPFRTAVPLQYRDNNIPDDGSTSLIWESGEDIDVYEIGGTTALDLTTSPTWADADQGNKSLELEAVIDATEGNSQKLQATYTNPDGEDSPIGERDFTLVKLDMDVDANNDGMIDDDDEADEATTGALVLLNDDDDDDDGTADKDQTGPITDEDDLEEIQLNFTPNPNEGEVSLVVTPNGNGDINIWEDATKTTQVDLSEPWDLSSDTLPTSLYVEGVAASSSAGDVELTLKYQPDDTLIIEDSVVFTLLKVDLSADPGKIHWGFDPPNLDPASGENDDPSVYWASVVQGNTNNIVNLNIPGADFSKFEWIKHDGDGATVTHLETATGDSTDLTITATGSGSAIQEPEFHLVVKGSTQPLLTLNVMVLPPRGPISLGVYHVEDSSSPNTQFATAPAVSKVSGASIVSMCNDVFEQAGITFELDASSNDGLSANYDTKKNVWDASNNIWIIEDGADGKVQRAEYDSIAESSSFPAAIDLFFLKNSGTIYDISQSNPLYIRAEASTNEVYREAYMFLSDTEGYVEIATAHELAHLFQLSRANNQNDNGDHDNPPYPSGVNSDVFNLSPPAARPGHKSNPNPALMQGGSPENGLLPWPWGRWMRHEDWRFANEYAPQI